MDRTEWLASLDPAVMLEWVTKSSLPRLQNVPPSARKLRLYAVACCRQVWHLLTDAVVCARCRTYRQNLPPDPGCSDCGGTGRVNRSRRAVEVAEQFADGLATEEELLVANRAGRERPEGGYLLPGTVPESLSWAASQSSANLHQAIAEMVRWKRLPSEEATQAALLREIVGDHGSPVTLTLLDRSAIVGWHGGLIRRVAAAAYDDRGEDGALCPDSLAVLADALEDAGCTEQTLLRHLRGEELVHWDNRKPVPSVYNHWRPLRGPHVRGCWAVDLLLAKE